MRTGRCVAEVVAAVAAGSESERGQVRDGGAGSAAGERRPQVGCGGAAPVGGVVPEVVPRTVVRVVLEPDGEVRLERTPERKLGAGRMLGEALPANLVEAGDGQAAGRPGGGGDVPGVGVTLVVGRLGHQHQRLAKRSRARWCAPGRSGRSRWRCRRGQAKSPAGSLLDPVVSPAERQQVARRGAADRPGPHVVEVAEPGGHRAAGEAAATVPGADQGCELGARSVRVGREGVARVESRPGERVARHELRSSPLRAAAGDQVWPWQVVAQPGPAHEQRLGRPRPLHLDEVSRRRVGCRRAVDRPARADARPPVGRGVSAGTVRTTCTSTVALPVTRSVRALPRACSTFEQVPAATRSWARRSIAAHAAAASSLGKVPCHSSTPGSATQRRSPVEALAFFARSRTRSGEMRLSSTRVRRRRPGASSSKCPPSAETIASATSAGAPSSSNATTPAR